MQQTTRSPAAAVVLAVMLIIGSSAVGAVRTRSMAFHEARERRAANYIGPQDAASAHRKLLQLPASPSAQIFLDGILEAATLDATCAGSKVCGGSLTVNGIVCTVPKNLMVMFPASALTWQEIFDPTTGKTGLALADPPAFGTYLVSVAANRVIDPTTKVPQIIAALLDISQDATSTGSGYIDSIDYGTGVLHIESGTGSTKKIRLNDPTGRFGLPQAGLDPRFSVDVDNPTIHAVTGYPMCIPTVDPNTAAPAPSDDDPNCSKAQRPLDPAGNPATIINMNDPTLATPTAPLRERDPTKMVPFRVGDYVTYAGVLVDATTFAAYEVISNVAVYTSPQTSPAYTSFETALIGTGGLNVLGVGEAAVRSRFEGWTTDPLTPVQLYAMDFDPTTGAATTRDFGAVMPDPGATFVGGATRGRWRFRPPCTVQGPLSPLSTFQGNKGCTPPAAGVYTTPPREVMAAVQGCTPTKIIDAQGNKLDNTCSYRNPTIEYIWPENAPGTPVVQNNFNVVDFLAKGGYTSAGKTQVARLDPWPGSDAPLPAGFDLSKVPVDATLNIQTIVFRCDKHRMTITASIPAGNPTPPLFLANFIDNSGKPGKPVDITAVGNTFSLAVPPAAPAMTITIEPVPMPSQTQNSLVVFYTTGGAGGKGGKSSPIPLNVNQVKASGGKTCTL